MKRLRFSGSSLAQETPPRLGHSSRARGGTGRKPVKVADTATTPFPLITLARAVSRLWQFWSDTRVAGRDGERRVSGLWCRAERAAAEEHRRLARSGGCHIPDAAAGASPVAAAHERRLRCSFMFPVRWTGCCPCSSRASRNRRFRRSEGCCSARFRRLGRGRCAECSSLLGSGMCGSTPARTGSSARRAGHRISWGWTIPGSTETGLGGVPWEDTASVIPKPTQQALRTLEWVNRAEVLVACGPSGTGRSHLIEALGHLAIDKGCTVAWHTLETLAAQVSRSPRNPGWLNTARSACANPRFVLPQSTKLRRLKTPRATRLLCEDELAGESATVLLGACEAVFVKNALSRNVRSRDTPCPARRPPVATSPVL